MSKILMVCLGNICRSPLAEGIMRDELQKAGLKDFIIDSAGTSSWHSGEHPDSRSIQNAKKHGVDISKLVARTFTKKDFQQFDHIFVMDASNHRDVLQLASGEDEKNKVEFLLNEKWPGTNRAVPDPYYGGEDGFENVFQLIQQACEAFAVKMKKRRA